MDSAQLHIPVLAESVRNIFASLHDMDGVFIDCTLGLGGHSKIIATNYPKLHLIGIDKDASALALARQHLKSISNSTCATKPCAMTLLHADFANGFIEALELARKWGKPVLGVLADIGVSSLQLDDKQRGFSFASDRLDMRMDTRISQHASMVIERYSEYALAEIFAKYGETPNAKRLARMVKEFASTQPKDNGFYNASALARWIASISHRHKIHPATKVFQALRIEVNNELAALTHLLESIAQTSSAPILSSAIIGIISFHSLEDRLVKEHFKALASNCICQSGALLCMCGGGHSKGRILTKKPITPSLNEVRANPRARSAKLRAFAMRDAKISNDSNDYLYAIKE